VARAFASQSVDQGSISWPSRTKRLQKWAFTASLLDVQHLKGLMWR